MTPTTEPRHLTQDEHFACLANCPSSARCTRHPDGGAVIHPQQRFLHPKQTPCNAYQPRAK